MLANIGQNPVPLLQTPALAAVRILRQVRLRLGNPRKSGTPASLNRGQGQSKLGSQFSIRRPVLGRQQQFLIGLPKPELRNRILAHQLPSEPGTVTAVDALIRFKRRPNLGNSPMA